MKTTIVLDKKKLSRIMKHTGLKTQRAALDYALRHALRIAEFESSLGDAFFVDEKEIIDPAYDVEALRHLERPNN